MWFHLKIKLHWSSAAFTLPSTSKSSLSRCRFKQRLKRWGVVVSPSTFRFTFLPLQGSYFLFLNRRCAATAVSLTSPLMLRLMFWWVGFCGWSWFLLTRFWFFQQMGRSLLFGFALPLSPVLLGSWWRLVCSNHDLVIGLMILGGGCGSLHGECCRSLHPYCVDLDF